MDLDLQVGLMEQVVTSRLADSVKYVLVNVIETYFPLSDKARESDRELISREEYRNVQEVEQTYFDELREEIFVQSKRETLKRQLTAKFSPLPAPVRARIDALTKMEELDAYLDRVLTAGSLEEMGFEG